jgi:hypothetical protein
MRGVVAGESPDERQTTFLPLIGFDGEPPEETGAVFVSWDSSDTGRAEPGRWTEEFAGLIPPLSLTMMSISTAMDALDESPRAVAGAVLGCARRDVPEDQVEAMQVQMATLAAQITRQVIKLLYLLDSSNVELAPATVSRQVRREVERRGGEIAWTVRIREPTRQERGRDETPGTRDYSHRFEVRGNFAHYREGSWLYEHSAPEEIGPCPRCGSCRRVWRSSHIKGPTDKPLAIKIRRVEFRD